MFNKNKAVFWFYFLLLLAIALVIVGIHIYRNATLPPIPTKITETQKVYRVFAVSNSPEYKVTLEDTTNGVLLIKRSDTKCANWKDYPVGTEVVLNDVTYEPHNASPYVVLAVDWLLAICN
jgi:hypothetical protein